MSNKSTEYKATFTLSQTGMEGDVHSRLTFSPFLGDQDPDAEAPLAFEQMSYLVQVYLEQIGMIDKDGNLLLPEKFHDEHAMVVSTIGSDKIN